MFQQRNRPNHSPILSLLCIALAFLTACANSGQTAGPSSVSAEADGPGRRPPVMR